MEDLNKNQIILLTLLVSFVTSIATGIMTVSLLQQAPLEVTRNINRIVEKTIETVTPATPTNIAQKEVTTVVVKEEDLVLASINKNLKSIVRIREKDLSLDQNSFYGIGLVINKDGMIATNRRTITPGNTYIANMSDGTEFTLTPTGVDKQTNFILFKIVQPDKSSILSNYVFVPATLSSGEAQLGQTLISLGGDTTNAISVGRVVSLNTKDSGVGTTTVKVITSIDTDVSTKDLVSGSPIFNLSGDIVGIKTFPDDTKLFIPVSVLKKEINSLTEPVKSS